MTISYSDTFLKLLLRWHDSLWKSIWRDLLIYLTLYYSINLAYRFGEWTTQQKLKFKEDVDYCEKASKYIPLTFLLGFFVSSIVSRWWDQCNWVSWPDRFMIYVTTYICGPQYVVFRCTIARWCNLMSVLCWRNLSIRTVKRFPTIDHLVMAGLMTEQELKTYQRMETPYGKWWLPAIWISNLLKKAHDMRVIDPIQLRDLMTELMTYRGGFEYSAAGLGSYTFLSDKSMKMQLDGHTYMVWLPIVSFNIFIPVFLVMALVKFNWFRWEFIYITDGRRRLRFSRPGSEYVVLTALLLLSLPFPYLFISSMLLILGFEWKGPFHATPLPENPMFVYLFHNDSSVGISNTVVHWGLSISGWLIHSVGSPITGRGRIDIRSINESSATRILEQVSRKFFVGMGNINRRYKRMKDLVYDLDAPELISTGISCQEHAIAYAMSMAQMPLWTFLLSFKQLRWRHSMYVVAIIAARLMTCLPLFDIFLMVASMMFYDEITRAMYFAEIGNWFIFRGALGNIVTVRMRARLEREAMINGDNEFVK